LTGCSVHTLSPLQEDSLQNKKSIKANSPKNTLKKKTTTTKSCQVTMKTKKFAFSDSGFLKETRDKIKLQLYATGITMGEIVVYKDENKICFKRVCNTKKWFNDNFLSNYYPKNTIMQILQSKPIMDRKNLKQNFTGFTQNIKTYDYDITYMVVPKSIYFRDRQNRILIRIKG
jgi:hypothetical protein